ncbi:MAG: heparinase II/III family protein [Pacificibacter sp.]|uniref:heparinase II/III family protein n=1 Tax=Pacificibacter sp. TaxID=1917866 RepID=UPI00321A5FF6
MSQTGNWRAKMTRRMNRFHAWRAARASVTTAFVSQPEPKSIGSYAKGRQLNAGNFLFAGQLIEAQSVAIWDLNDVTDDFVDELQGFAWLDDLAAVGDDIARGHAQDWILLWLERYGRGSGRGWRPDLTGRRLTRWINHSSFCLSEQPEAVANAFYTSLAQQTLFLSRRWHTVPTGLPRFEALAGLIYASLSLHGMQRHVEPAVHALARACSAHIDDTGAVPSRNPEELLEIFTLLTWTAGALSDAGLMADAALVQTIDRIAPVLRTLRHSDGSLARFHGGGRGLEGRLDYALASSGNTQRPSAEPHMGFVRLSAGRTSVITDVAPPVTGEHSIDAHASTLAFELTSGRRPLIVNCGAGTNFGDDWRRAGRATPSHSTLAIEGFSSSRLGTRQLIGGRVREFLIDVPQSVRLETHTSEAVIGFVAAHNGYTPTHGLTHIRKIDLSTDGRGIVGEDTLATITSADEAQFDLMTDKVTRQGVPFRIRFHLHPDVAVEHNVEDGTVAILLKSGEVWVFEHDGSAKLSVESSVYLEKDRLKPRGCKQVVLSAAAMDYATRVRWSLAKARGTPSALRDLERDEDILT